MVIDDVRKGRGAEIAPGDAFSANYSALDYASGEKVEEFWRTEPFQWSWRTDQLTQGSEIGLEGMRVGGLRKLVVPSRLAYGSGTRVYMVELLRVEPSDDEPTSSRSISSR